MLTIIFEFQVQQIMDKFEQQTENLDVQANAMDESMGAATTLSTPADQVTLAFCFQISLQVFQLQNCIIVQYSVWFSTLIVFSPGGCTYSTSGRREWLGNSGHARRCSLCPNRLYCGWV